MKLVVFAHTPPPHHGQSYMVKLMLDGLGGDARKRKADDPNGRGIECYHVNARFSRSLEDVGEFQKAKLFLIFWFCAQALWLRFRYDARNLYYVPAPGKRVALYRDWLIMLLCRPFFKNIILHWHAAGMAKWLETSNGIYIRAATYRLFRPVNLSIVLSKYNFADAEKLLSRNIQVVNNGIPDPCPDFDEQVLPRRRESLTVRKRVLAGESAEPSLVLQILYLAHCSREKGIFAAAEAVLRANQELAARHLPVKLKLTAAGNFVTPNEQFEFERLRQRPEAAGFIEHLGFVAGAQKDHLLREADLFLFPTRYLGENQPVNLIEAMAFGLPIVTTRWRSLPEMFPADYAGLVSGQDAGEIAGALLKVLSLESGEPLRRNFSARFALEQHLNALCTAIRSVEEAGPASS